MPSEGEKSPEEPENNNNNNKKNKTGGSQVMHVHVRLHPKGEVPHALLTFQM